MGAFGGGIKSIQESTVVLSDSELTNTATISAVVLTKSYVIHNGSSSSENYVSADLFRVDLTSTTIVTATRGTINDGTETHTVSFTVIEHY